MSVPRNPYFGTYLHDSDAEPGMVPRWPHKDAVTPFRLSNAGFRFLCEFNGYDPLKAPRSCMYAPNQEMFDMIETWAPHVEERHDFIAWSRRPGQQGKPKLPTRKTNERATSE